MLFWIIVALLALVVAFLLARPLLLDRAGMPAPVEQGDMAIYRDQLAEVARDLERGVLSETEAERTRTEIARRLLAADKAGVRATDAAPALASGIATGVAAALVVGGSLALYAWLGAPGYPDLPRASRMAEAEDLRASRPSQAELETQVASTTPPASPPLDAPADYMEMVERLREVVPTRPEDAQGWTLLARNEAALGNYSAAVDAQEHLVTLLGGDVSVDELVFLADVLVAAAGGRVSPETDDVLKRILALDPRSLPAQYYVGLLFAQTGRPDEAFTRWRVVAEQGDPADSHTRLAREQIEDIAVFAGVEYTLPADAAMPGPSAEDVAAAQGMNAGDRSAMIESMVARLSDRLASQGGSPDEWARLVSSLGVLGRTEDARAIWTEAQSIYANDPEALAVVREGAVAAGVAE